MSSSSFRRNRLVCRIALELGLVDASATDEALRAWESSQETNLEDILFRAGAISEAHRSAIRALVDSSPSEPPRLPSGSGVPVERELEPGLHSVDRAASTDRKKSTAASRMDVSDQDSPTLSWHRSESRSSGRFRFLRDHARGGLGTVSVAEDAEFGREVALKEIRPEHGLSRESRDRFMFEGMVTGRLEHPGIVPVYSLGVADGQRPYYAMRFIRGESLRQAIKAHCHPRVNEPAEDQLPWLRRIVRRLIDVCNAISYAHSCGVVHRDLKPANIMLGPYGETLVVDWGLAKPVGQKPCSEGGKPLVMPEERVGDDTRQGSVVGTLSYMSPEQARGENDAIGPQTDVFCLGATLYCVLTGEAPYGGKDDDESRESIRNARFPRPRTANPSLPRSLEAICLKAMSAQPHDRYGSAASLGEDLERWLIDEPVMAFPEPWLDRVGRFIRRNRTGVLSALALLALTAVGGIVFSLVLDNKNREINNKNLAITTANSQLTEARDSLDQSLKTAREATMKMIAQADKDSARNDPLRAPLMESALAMYKRIHELRPHDDDIAWELARALRMVGNLLRLEGRFEEAQERYDQGIELLRDLPLSGGADAHSPGIELALTLVDLGAMQRALGQLEAALGSVQSSVEIAAGMTDDKPGRTEVLRTRAVANNELAGLLRDLGRNEEVLPVAELAADTFEALANGPTANQLDHVFCLKALGNHSMALADLGRIDEAMGTCLEGNRLADAWHSRYDDPNTRFSAIMIKLQWAGLLHDYHSSDETSAALIEEAAELATLNCKDNPGVANFQYQLAEVHRLRGGRFGSQGRTAEAISELETARRLLEPVADASEFAGFRLNLARILRDHAALTADPVARKELLGVAEIWCQKVLATAPENEKARAELGRIRNSQQLIQ